MRRPRVAVDHILPKLTTFSPVLVASSVENWGILRGTVFRIRKTIRLFSAATKIQPQNPRLFFSGVACDDSNVEAVFAKEEETFLYCPIVEEKEETFLLDSNVEEKKKTFLCDPNVEEKKETFLSNTISEKKEESFLYHPSVSSEDRGETVPFSGSDSSVVCPQEFFAGVEHGEFLVYADHLLFGSSLNFPGVDCVVRAGMIELFLSGLSEDCVMEADTAGPLSYGLFVDSPDAKSLAIHIQNGVSVRAACKAKRK